MPRIRGSEQGHDGCSELLEGSWKVWKSYQVSLFKRLLMWSCVHFVISAQRSPRPSSCSGTLHRGVWLVAVLSHDKAQLRWVIEHTHAHITCSAYWVLIWLNLSTSSLVCLPAWAGFRVQASDWLVNARLACVFMHAGRIISLMTLNLPPPPMCAFAPIAFIFNACLVLYCAALCQSPALDCQKEVEGWFKKRRGSIMFLKIYIYV